MERDNEFVLDLSPEDIKALEDSYPALAEKPAEKKVERATRSDSDPAPQKTAKVEKPVDDEAETLRRRLREADERIAAERTKRIEAERLADEKSKRVASADVQVAESRHAAVANALSMRSKELDSIKAQHLAALEGGDYKAVTEASDKMAKLQAEMLRLSEGKDELENVVARARVTAKTEADKPAPADTDADPVEKYIRQFKPREQAWLREHPECITDPELNAKMTWADAQAKKKGIAPGSDEYFAHIDGVMGYGGDGQEEVVETGDSDERRAAAKAKTDEPARAVEKKAPATKRVAAPVTRDGVLARTSDGRSQWVLSPQEAQMADDLGISRAAYARNLYKLQQGERDPNYRGPRLSEQ